MAQSRGRRRRGERWCCAAARGRAYKQAGGGCRGEGAASPFAHTHTRAITADFLRTHACAARMRLKRRPKPEETETASGRKISLQDRKDSLNHKPYDSNFANNDRERSNLPNSTMATHQRSRNPSQPSFAEKYLPLTLVPEHATSKTSYIQRQKPLWLQGQGLGYLTKIPNTMLHRCVRCEWCTTPEIVLNSESSNGE